MLAFAAKTNVHASAVNALENLSTIDGSFIYFINFCLLTFCPFISY
jgi:hypothetical protein